MSVTEKLHVQRFKGAWAELICQVSNGDSGDNFRLIPPNFMVGWACVLKQSLMFFYGKKSTGINSATLL